MNHTYSFDNTGASEDVSKNMVHYGIGVSVEENGLYAAILIDGTIQKIFDENGKDFFERPHLSEEYSFIFGAIKRILECAWEQYHVLVDKVVLAVPVTMSLNDQFILVSAMRQNGIYKYRFMYKSEAQAVYLWGTLGVAMEGSIVVICISGRTSEIAVFEIGDTVLETMMVENLLELKEAYERVYCITELKKDFDHIYICGDAGEDKRLQEILENIKFEKQLKMRYDPAYGAAAYAGKLMGQCHEIFTEVLAIPIFYSSISINDEIICPSGMAIPTRRFFELKRHEIAGKYLNVKFEGLQGKSEEFEFDISDMGEELELTIDIDNDKNVMVNIADIASGEKKSFDLFSGTLIAQLKGKNNSGMESEKKLIESLIAIGDDLYSSIKVLQKSGDVNTAKGLQMILKYKVDSMLESYNIFPIESIGCAFDPNLHNAVGHVEGEQWKENEIIDEYRRGYMKNHKLLRASDVVVAN